MMIAVFMNQVKSERNSARDQVPPPEGMPLLSNHPGSGNMHIIQQIFEGAFEVSSTFTPLGLKLIMAV
jgi:hypothetical protein